MKPASLGDKKLDFLAQEAQVVPSCSKEAQVVPSCSRTKCAPSLWAAARWPGHLPGVQKAKVEIPKNGVPSSTPTKDQMHENLD